MTFRTNFLCFLTPISQIFGPILPIVSISSPEEAIAYINRGEKPLTMYLFTTDKNVTEKFLNETSAGSVCANDTVIHLTRKSIQCSFRRKF